MSEGRATPIPEGSRQVVAYVALQEKPVDRRVVAGTLWPDVEDLRAAGNLRTALWRLRRAELDIIVSVRLTLELRAGTDVDVHRLRRWTDALLDGKDGTAERWPLDWTSEVPVLLPGWYDDWVLLERERLRQRVLGALEQLSSRERKDGRYPEAIDAALLAVAIDPVRESAQRALIDAHLAEGNMADARRVYDQYRSLLIEELGVEPSRELTMLVRAPRPSPADKTGALCPTCRSRVATART